MKIVLIEEVTGLGKPGDQVEVADGYGRNYLLPRKLALEATPGNLKNLEIHKRVLAKREQELITDAQAAAEAMKGITLILKAKAGEAGRIYGSITAANVAEALERDHRVQVDKRKIELADPIKVLGSHEAKVKLHQDVEATVAIEVVPLEEPLGEPEPEQPESQ